MKFSTIKKNIGLLLATGLLFNLTACNDFLKEESQSEVIPQTATDYAELLMGSGYPGEKEPFNFTYLMDDDVEFNRSFTELVGTDGAIEQFPTFTWQPDFVNRNGLGTEIAATPNSTGYAQYYTWIMGCNAVLDNIDEAIGTQEQRDRVRAEALAVRAFLYFRLANVYGEPYYKNPEALAVPLKLNSNLEETYFKRATVQEVYTQVVNDLNEAARLLEPLDIVRGDYHINQRAVQIILSRVYLYMEDWDNCIAHANAVFELGGKIAMLSPYVGGEEPENSYLTYDNAEVEWIYGGNTQITSNPYIPKASFVASFADNDARKSYFSGKSSASGTYYILSKLQSGAALSQVLRSSEALLNRAEAYAQKQETALAAKDLNELRKNRISDYSDESFSSPAEVLTAIRNERRKEFCYEGFRWYDLRRYGMPAIEHEYQAQLGEPVQTYTLEEEDPMYTLPFPNSLTSKNPEMIQNPSANAGPRAGQ